MDKLNEKQADQSDNLGHSQSIKAAIHCCVGQITEEVGSGYGLTFTKPLVATISELINRQIEVYAIDLEMFAKHARRTTINCCDVKLLARRNPKMKAAVIKMVDAVEASGSGTIKKGPKRQKVQGSETTRTNPEVFNSDNGTC